MNFAQNLIKIRTQKNLTRDRLATELEITEKLLESWEKEESEPTASQLARLSKIFDLSIDKLLGIEEKKPIPNPLASLAMPFLEITKLGSNPQTIDNDEDDDEYIRELIEITSKVDLARKRK